MKTVLYETGNPLRPGERWICWLTEERTLIDKDRKPTGETKTVFLPVYFFGEGPMVAEERALAFWNDEKAKATAKKERGRALGASRRAA